MEGAENIGAFIAEPLMGAGGVIIPPKSYFEMIQPILKRNEILFIADEVISGFGRTGNMWGSQTFNIKPDIVTCAKGLSSAYAPISAVLMSENISKQVEKQAIKLGQFGHGYTYSGHPVSSAVALRTLEIMEERDIITHVRDITTLFSKRISELKKYRCIGNVRSIGLIGAAEFIKPGTKREKIDPQHKFAAKVVKKIHEKGVILRALPIDAIAFCPPLIISKDEIDQMFDRIETILPEMDQVADSAGFIVAYPQGSFVNGYSYWNSMIATEGSKGTADDVGFISILIDEISSNYNIDLSKVYACGYSNGGDMAISLACYLSDKISAVAPVSGLMSQESDSLCEPNQTTGVFIINGTADNERPYSGINDYYLSVDNALAYWSNYHLADSVVIEEFVDGNNNAIELYTYLNQSGLSFLQHYKIIGGGHYWFDLSVNDENLDQLIWRFFKKHSRD